MDSILTSIKKLLGIEDAETHFDAEITMHINSIFMILTQLGVGPIEGFVITNSDTVWTDYINDPIKSMSVQSYMYLKVKLLFDPPSSSFVVDSMNKQINEYEWRLNNQDEPTIIS